MLEPAWIEKSIVTDECKKRIFPESFVMNTRQRNQNNKLLLRKDIHLNLVAFAHDSCWNPDDAIVSVRRHLGTGTTPSGV